MKSPQSAAAAVIAAAAVVAAAAIVAAAVIAAAAVAAKAAAPAAPEQDEEDQDDPDPAVIVVGTEHGMIPFPALYSQRPPRADQVRREPVRQRNRFPPLSAYTMSFIRRV